MATIAASTVWACTILIWLASAVGGRPTASIGSDREALLAFKERITDDPGNVLRSWNPSAVTPCGWEHVICDHGARVIGLDLGNKGISGTLAPELGDLDALIVLDLYGNKLSGHLPPELAKLQFLVSLDLSDNELSGSIPGELGLFGLSANLKYLLLNENYLSGTIPATIGIFELYEFDVTNNNLSGFLPTTFSRYNIDSFHPGNDGLCGGPPINKAC